MIRKIGILSDTHGLLRPEVLDTLQGCDAILHGGDINRQNVLDVLQNIAPVYVVRGNNDRDWAEKIPLRLDFSLYGLRVCMAHKKKDLPEDLSVYDLVIYGHSHRYEEKREGNTILLNPGSCGPRRFNQDITMAVLLMEDQEKTLEVQRIDILHTDIHTERIDKNMIEKVIREIRKGKSVVQISDAFRLNPELAEQICRLYLTHPGVDADGIMTKMGL